MDPANNVAVLLRKSWVMAHVKSAADTIEFPVIEDHVFKMFVREIKSMIWREDA